MDERKRIVGSGYDVIGRRYLEWGRGVEGDPRERMLADFVGRVPKGGRVLDLGCGAGVPTTRSLAERFEVVGLDISPAQLEMARANVPDAEFVLGDIASVEFPAASFDGVAAFYSISHLPRDEHAGLFAQVRRWLVPGGVFLATLGASDSPDWIGEWLGVPMFFSSHPADANRQLLTSAGFELLVDEVVETHEPDGSVAFLWVIARKAA